VIKAGRWSIVLNGLLPALVFALLLAGTAPLNAATPKAGAKCTKAGITATAAGKKFTCVKSGNKLVWNKGVAVKAAPKPSPNPVFKPAQNHHQIQFLNQ